MLDLFARALGQEHPLTEDRTKAARSMTESIACDHYHFARALTPDDHPGPIYNDVSQRAERIASSGSSSDRRRTTAPASGQVIRIYGYLSLQLRAVQALVVHPLIGARSLRALSLPHRTGADVHSMAVKTKLILGAYLLETQHDAEAELVRKNLRDVDADELERAEADLLSADRAFFEVTDRQLNLEYVPPERREALRRFCRSLAETATVPLGPKRRDSAPAAG
jgi:hypothetical protein